MVAEPVPARLPGVVVAGPAGWPAVVELFLAGKRGNTAAAYRTDLAQFATWCTAQGIDPLAATRANLTAYRQALEDIGRSPSTVNRKLSAIAGAYTTAVAEDVLARSPVTHVERPKVDEHQALGMTRTEALDLIQAATTAGLLERALLMCLLLNGLRISEATGADVGHLLNERGHRILKITRKGAKDRGVPLAPWTADSIDTYLAGRRTGPLFRRDDGGRLSRHAAARLVARIGRDAGLDHLTPHMLRHAYVTFCLDAGIPLHKVQDSADHADPRTTQRYNDRRRQLDDHPTYTLVDYLAGRIGPGGADPQGTLF